MNKKRENNRVSFMIDINIKYYILTISWKFWNKNFTGKMNQLFSSLPSKFNKFLFQFKVLDFKNNETPKRKKKKKNKTPNSQRSQKSSPNSLLQSLQNFSNSIPKLH